VAERALTFGAVARNYEHYRIGYPAAVVDLVMSYAGGPIATALEIGAGTGKATRVFAERGIAVTASEPDADMIAELRQHVPSEVSIVQASFEELSGRPTYDLVYVAAALHWTKPEGRWSRVAALLKPAGVFANFGGNVEIADSDLRARVRAARAPILDDADIVPPDGTPIGAPMQWPGSELERTELFTDVEQHVIAERLAITAQEYVGMLSTVSAFLLLSPEDLQNAVDLMLAVLPAQVELSVETFVHLARRAG
jgi:SAM-dependent methyltransferase